MRTASKRVMKFSEAETMALVLVVGVCPGWRWEGLREGAAGVWWGLSATVAGRPMRSRSVALGTSSWGGVSVADLIIRMGDGLRTHIPLSFEALQVSECSSDRLVGEIALVLPQQSITRLGVLALLDRVSQVRLLQGIESDDDAVDLG